MTWRREKNNETFTHIYFFTVFLLKLDVGFKKFIMAATNNKRMNDKWNEIKKCPIANWDYKVLKVILNNNYMYNTYSNVKP